MAVHNEFLKYEETESFSGYEYEIKNKDEKTNLTVNEVFEKHFPPVVINEGDQSKTRRVSQKPLTVFEMFDLKDAFTAKIKELEGTQHFGFSSKVRNLHDQLFEELIRQEIIECPQRGALLKSIQAEMSYTLESLRKTIRSSFAYGLCKSLLSCRAIVELRKEIAVLQEQIESMQNRSKNIREESMEQQTKKKHNAAMISLQFDFLEKTLEIENEKLTRKIEEKIDTEHKWLKEIKKETGTVIDIRNIFKKKT